MQTEISKAIRLMAGALHETGDQKFGLIVCSIDVKQACDNVSLPKNLILVKKE